MTHHHCEWRQENARALGFAVLRAINLARYLAGLGTTSAFGGVGGWSSTTGGASSVLHCARASALSCLTDYLQFTLLTTLLPPLKRML